MNETELLRRFVEENAQEAFAQLVRDKINLVYAAALRQVGGDSHLAQDVTQSVFLALACHAAKLKHHAVLTGWLYTTTRFLAAKALRGQRRWQRRETEATTMTISADQSDGAWEELRPVIDDSLHELGESDRAVLLLRFFEGRTQAEVGAAVGVTENAARMRIDRALEKLRTRLARRGITSTAVALGAALAAQPAIAAPAGLAASVTSMALGCATVSAVTMGAGGVVTAALLNFMNTTKLVLGTIGAAVVFGAGAFVGGHSPVVRDVAPENHTTVETGAEIARLRKENGQLREQIAQKNLEEHAAESVKSVIAGSDRQDPLAERNKWKLLAEMSKQKLLSARVTFIDSAGKLDQGMVSLFDLTPDEHESLSRAIDTAREKIETLERTNATVTRQPDGKIVIAVKPFPGAGGGAYDELMSGISQTLGPERNAAFQMLCVDQVEKALGSFGAAERKVTVTSQPGKKDSRYLATDERVAPGSRNSNSSNYGSREDLLKRVGTITKLLPPEF